MLLTTQPPGRLRQSERYTSCHLPAKGISKKSLSLQMADCSISDVLGPMQNEKGMQGIDCRVRNKIKGELCIP